MVWTHLRETAQPALDVRSGPHEFQHASSNFVVDTRWYSDRGFGSADGQLGGLDIADLRDLDDGRYSAVSPNTFANGGNVPASSPVESVRRPGPCGEA